MDQHLSCRLDIALHGGQVVSFGMPGQSACDVFVRYGDSDLAARLEQPLNVPLLLCNRNSFYFPSLLGNLKDGLGCIDYFACCELWCNKMDQFLIIHGQEAVRGIRAPLNAINDLVWKLN